MLTSIEWSVQQAQLRCLSASLMALYNASLEGQTMSVISAFKNLFSDSQQSVIDANDEDAIKAWLVERLAKHLKREANTIESSKPFEEYGLDSLFAVQVTGELEKVVERRLSPALLFENTCIDDVAKVISQQAQ